MESVRTLTAHRHGFREAMTGVIVIREISFGDSIHSVPMIYRPGMIII